nr:hypothetical protein [uncultured Holophaga sp.]
MAFRQNDSILVDCDYKDIPWYRKRWALVLLVLLFIPAAIIILLTGETYLKRKGLIYEVSEKRKKSMAFALTAVLAVNLVRLFI